MSDDIIDTIAAALIGPLWAGFEGADNCYCDPEMGIIDTSGNWVSFCMGDVTKTVAPLLLAALRGAGYEIVKTEEAKLISLENQPPSAPVAAEADQ